MKKLYTGSLILALLFSAATINVAAQNIPQSGSIPNIYLFNGSGSSVVFLPQLSDGDGNSETVTVEAVSDNESMVSIGTISYSSDNTFGLLELTAEGVDGTANISVTITDSDGSIDIDFVATVGPYTNNGSIFEIHDIIFWQEKIPLSGVPVFDTVIQTTEAPYDEIDFESLDITVDAVKDDFFTGLFKGYLIPKVSGEYRFSILMENDGGVWVGNSISGASPMVVVSENHGTYGTVDPSTNHLFVSEPIALEAGKVYGYYGVQWIVHATYGGIQWEGPGIERSYISSEYLFTEYDLEKPSPPAELSLDVQGVNYLRFSWDEAEDNKEVAGYNIYLDGVLVNAEPSEEIDGFIVGLDAETKYSIAVTSIDKVGNESLPSTILSVETYAVDTNPPSPPTEASIITQAGLALEIEWSGANDVESAVNGYNLYLDGVLFNTDAVILENSLIINGLSPETEYSITIESVDAGGKCIRKEYSLSFFKCCIRSLRK